MPFNIMGDATRLLISPTLDQPGSPLAASQERCLLKQCLLLRLQVRFPICAFSPSIHPSSAVGLDSPHGCPSAAVETLHPGRTGPALPCRGFLGPPGRPAATPPFLLPSLQVMVTNVTSLLKTVKAVEDEATRGTRALEATIEYIKQELTVVLPPSPVPRNLAKLRFMGLGRALLFS